LELKSKIYQLEVLDILSGLESERNLMNQYFIDFQNLKRQLETIETELATVKATQDYNQFVLGELNDLQLDKTDYSILENELNRIENAESLKSFYHTVVDSIENQGLYSNLKSAKTGLDKFVSLDNQVASFTERLNSLMIELKELSSDANKSLEDLEFSGFNAMELTEKLDAFNRILSKHRLVNQEQLKVLKTDLESKVSGLEDLEFTCDSLRDELKLKYNSLVEFAEVLHEKRVSATPSIENELKQILNTLKLPDTDLKFELIKTAEINASGNSEISFLFSANKGMAAVPVEKAASGGELSRVMLALQKMVSEKRDLPTILFDEIDTGVSGDVAQKIGQLLNQMGKKVQLIAISHLPQVAAKAGNHLVVSKRIENNQMKTHVYSINSEERVIEIARLLSGEQISDAALSNAKNLMLN
jgi:DNA repair protein RecN (Recombination protein N)